MVMNTGLFFETGTSVLNDSLEVIPHPDWDDHVGGYRAEYPSVDGRWLLRHDLGRKHTFVDEMSEVLRIVTVGSDSPPKIADSAVGPSVPVTNVESDTRCELLTDS